MKRFHSTLVPAIGILVCGSAPTLAAPRQFGSPATTCKTAPQPITNTRYKFQVTSLPNFPLVRGIQEEGFSTFSPRPKDPAWNGLQYTVTSFPSTGPNVSVTIWAQRKAARTYGGYVQDVKKQLREGQSIATAMSHGTTRLRLVSLRNGVSVGSRKAYEAVYDTDWKGTETLRARMITLYGNGNAYTLSLAGTLTAFRKYEPSFNKIVASFKLLP